MIIFFTLSKTLWNEDHPHKRLFLFTVQLNFNPNFHNEMLEFWCLQTRETFSMWNIIKQLNYHLIRSNNIEFCFNVHEICLLLFKHSNLITSFTLLSGNLHFAFVEKKDESNPELYLCSLYNSEIQSQMYGSKTEVEVEEGENLTV